MFIETRQNPNQLRQERHGSFKNHALVNILMPLLTELNHSSWAIYYKQVALLLTELVPVRLAVWG